MSQEFIDTIIQTSRSRRLTIDMDRVRENIKRWPTLSHDSKIQTLQEVGYQVINDRVISYKAVDKDGFDMAKMYQYNSVGTDIVDTYSIDKEFCDPDPHTPGGIWSATIYYQAPTYKCNRQSRLNHYVKIDADVNVNDVRLCYDWAIKNRKVRVLEIHGTQLHL
jgi:hypothetical protein